MRGFNLRVGRRVLWVIGLGVAIPALVLASLGVYLTLRIARAIDDESVRYDTYMAIQIGEAFQHALLNDLTLHIEHAEEVARRGGPPDAILDTLQRYRGDFVAPRLVAYDDLNGLSVVTVESQILFYSPGEREHAGQVFAGLLMRGPGGDVVGGAGWWLEPREYLVRHLGEVTQGTVPSDPRLYGGYEQTRKLSIAVMDRTGDIIARVREPGNARTGRVAPLIGPFEGFQIRVAPATGAPPVWARRFVLLLLTLIGLMGMVIVLATAFGLRYTVRQLELAQLKASFVSNVTHELKTPIALIRLAVETLEMRRVKSPEETDAFLRSIERETLRLQQLVDNILDFARLEAGRRIFRFETVDLREVVRETVESFRPRLEHHGFRVDLDLPDELPAVRGDAAALSHCVLNLLDNALKYSKQRREVRVSAGARPDGAVAVSVTDWGIGIAPADQRRIFDKFVRVETGLVHNVKGTGLGLALVDQIMRAHGGRVEVVSSPGEGSTFTLVLPSAGAVVPSRIEPRQRTG
jgi:signal transduction histidine kinase